VEKKKKKKKRIGSTEAPPNPILLLLLRITGPTPAEQTTCPASVTDHTITPDKINNNNNMRMTPTSVQPEG